MATLHREPFVALQALFSISNSICPEKEVCHNVEAGRVAEEGLGVGRGRGHGNVTDLLYKGNKVLFESCAVLLAALFFAPLCVINATRMDNRRLGAPVRNRDREGNSYLGTDLILRSPIHSIGGPNSEIWLRGEGYKTSHHGK